MKKIIHILSALLILSSCAIAKKKNKQIPYGAGTYLIETTQGNITVRTFAETPLHSKNFDSLVRAGFYDGLLFHRVIPQFMIQGGDPKSKDAPAGTPLGSGDVGYRVPAEFSEKIYHKRGALAAARDGNPQKASSGCQFYIVQGQVWPESELVIDQYKLNNALGQLMQNPNYAYLQDTLGRLYYSGDMEAYKAKMIALAPTCEKELGISLKKEVSPERLTCYTTTGGSPHLDEEYTVFGKVISGMDVIDKIAAVQVDPRDRPLEDLPMIVTVEEMSKKKITKQYGYQFPESEKK